MEIKNEVKSWLKKNISGLNWGDDIKIFLFGSVCRKGYSHNDCDLLILYRSILEKKVITKSEYLRTEFKKHFGIPLNILRLSKTEIEEMQNCVAKIFQDGAELITI